MLLELFQSLEQMAVGDAIRNSLWLFPVIEAVHLVGLAILGGTVLVVDLRLLQVTLRRQSEAYVLRQARPYFIFALLLLIATGVPLALSEMIKLYYNYSFWVKMIALACALVFTFLIRNPIAVQPRMPRPVLMVLGLVSFGLWLTVAAAGRWIGFS